MSATVPEPEKTRAKQILGILEQNVPINEDDFSSLVVMRESHDPFRVLVVTILSQSCTDIAALRAYRALDRQVQVTSRTLSETRTQKIAGAIRIAGLHRQKAKALKRLARIIAEQHDPDILKGILEGPIQAARSSLQLLPKVGPKTADVLLGVWGRSTISVDTHVDRVSKRLGFARRKAGYEQVRSALMNLFTKEDYRSVPLQFMAHGRQICKAVKPQCSKCPVEHLCPFPRKNK